MTEKNIPSVEPIKINTTIKPQDNGSSYETFSDKKINTETADRK
jgi:hypothetical protein